MENPRMREGNFRCSCFVVLLSARGCALIPSLMSPGGVYTRRGAVGSGPEA